jgi:SagB-type dehydrogenase family enzyme
MSPIRRYLKLLCGLWLWVACGAPPMGESAGDSTAQASEGTNPIPGTAETRRSASGVDSTGDLSGALSIPRKRSDVSLEETLQRRRSIRRFQNRPLSELQVSQLLWAAQGVTRGTYRTAPSAGATYPLDTFIATAGGTYRYEPDTHRLTRTSSNDVRPLLSRAANGQSMVREAPVVIVLTMVEARTRARYGDRAPRYIAMEAGHAAQNIHLQAVALGLGSVPVGAMASEPVSNALGCSRDQLPLYMIPVGYSAESESR